MKVVIWIGCIFVATTLNTLLGYATGFKVGYLVFYFAVYFVAKKMCNKWDQHKEAKKVREEAFYATNAPVVETTTATANDIRFCRKCGEELLENSQFCGKCGTQIISED